MGYKLTRRSFFRATSALTIAMSTPYLAGCAGTAQGNKVSISKFEDTNFDASALSYDGPTPIIAIRYPAILSDLTERTFLAAYSSAKIGDMDQMVTPQGSKPQAMSALSKSVYFANEMYIALQARLPAGSVVMDPYTVYVDDNGALAPAPMAGEPLPPAAMTVEFFTYVHPNKKFLMDAPATSFGDIVAPLIAVWSHVDSNSTDRQRLIMASDALVEQQALTSASQDRGQSAILKFLNQSSGNGTGSAAQTLETTRSWPAENRTVYLLPTQSITLEPEAIRQGMRATVRGRNAFAQAFDPLLDAIAETGYDLYRRGNITQIVASHFNYTYLKGSRYALNDKEVAIARKIVNVERKFAAEKSKNVANAVLDGQYGRDIRDIMSSELKVLNERRKLAKEQNQAMALSMFMGFAGGMAAGVGTSAPAAQPGAMMMASEAEAAQLESQTIAQGFNRTFDRVYEEQFEYTGELAGSEFKVRATDFRDLRRKLEKLVAGAIAA